MAVHSFSTSEIKEPKEHEAVEEVKAYCKKHRINWSQLMVHLVMKYKEEQLDVQ